LIEKQAKMVIVDSIASVARKESDAIKRSDLLSKEASILKYLAESFEIPVVVTNQVTSRFEKDLKKFVVTPALGIVWSHSVNTRLVLEYFGDLNRRITVAKSPVSRVVSVRYVVNEGGISCTTTGGNGEDDQMTSSEVEIDSENYWETRIIPREQAAPGITVQSQHHVTVMKQGYGGFHYPTSVPPDEHPFFLSPPTNSSREQSLL